MIRIQLILIVIAVLFAIAYRFSKRDAYRKLFFLLFLVSAFSWIILPKSIWGKWNLLKSLENEKITKVIISPTVSDFDDNLIDTQFLISNSLKIDKLTSLFQSTETYHPSHQSSVWECNLVFISNNNNSLSFNVWKNRFNAAIITDINSQHDDGYQNKELSEYLEQLVDYKRYVRR